MKIHNTEIKFKPGECYDMDKEEHTLTLNLWQWDTIIDALRERRKRQEDEYRRYRELRQLQDWTSARKIIVLMHELEHQINCEIQYQIEGKRCDKCQAETETIIDHIIGGLAE